jgi:hypothetical protein
MPTIMPSALRDFWFPLLLAVIGVIPLFFAGSSSGNGRRLVLTITTLFFFAAILSYIWGDPVRGPFANMLHPDDAREFRLIAGVTCFYPVSRLSEGMNFSNCAEFGPPGREPLGVWIRKTWWSGLVVESDLKMIRVM